MNPVASKTAIDPRLLAGLKEHALKIQDVVLSNGARSTYYVDVKQAMLRPGLARIVGKAVAQIAHDSDATAVGGMVIGAVPIACAALMAQPGDDLVAFIVRKDRKEHGLQRWIEGPDDSLISGETRCLIVDDVVTTGSSTIEAIKRVQEANFVVAGVVSVIDRLAGGQAAIEAAAEAPYFALATIDDIHPDRPDRA